MPRKSIVISKIKEGEINWFKSLSPKERINLEFSHNAFIKHFFYAGLKAKGFTEEEIRLIWQRKCGDYK